jgi:hypothetical protein|tara:strand:+ start:665 stop:835 length:171 start_codon:yes stop_codon:yes gene_type:complete
MWNVLGPSANANPTAGKYVRTTTEKKNSLLSYNVANAKSRRTCTASVFIILPFETV